jgi:hypothetical protein
LVAGPGSYAVGPFVGSIAFGLSAMGLTLWPEGRREQSPLRNLPSIQRHGLLCSKSKGRLKAVWLATEGKSSWAALQVGRVERGEVDELHGHRARCATQHPRHFDDVLVLSMQLTEGQLAVQVEGDDQLIAGPVATGYGVANESGSTAGTLR